MNILKKSLLLFLICFTNISVAYAADATIVWRNAHNYSDLNVGESGAKQVKFVDKTLSKLEQYFKKLASDLPEDNNLLIVVDDVDLAGKVLPGRSRNRHMSEGTYPRVILSYKLTAKNGEIIQSDNVTLKDMHYLSSMNTVKPLRYEKKMLRRWFRSTFSTFMN